MTKHNTPVISNHAENSEINNIKARIKNMSPEETIPIIASAIYNSSLNQDIRAMAHDVLITDFDSKGADGLAIYQNLISNHLDDENIWLINHIFMTRIEWDIYKYNKQAFNDYCFYKVTKTNNEAQFTGYNYVNNIINEVKRLFGDKIIKINKNKYNKLVHIEQNHIEQKANTKTPMPIQKKVSAHLQARMLLEQHKNNINKFLDIFLDPEKSKKYLKLRIPLLKIFKNDEDINEQRIINNRKCYSNKILELGIPYLLCSDIYQKNVDELKQLFIDCNEKKAI